MKFLNKIFLLLGLVGIAAQPAMAMEIQDASGDVKKCVIAGAACFGFAGIYNAYNAIKRTLPKPKIDPITKQTAYQFRRLSELFSGRSNSSQLFMNNFGYAVSCGLISAGLYALSKRCC